MRAEGIFYKNKKHIIRVEVMSNEDKYGRKTFKGTLIEISGNIFIIKNDNGLIEMFRYEDMLNLSVIN